MPTKHWGEFIEEEENGTITSDKYVPTSVKTPKLEEINLRGEPAPVEKHHKIELNSSLVTQTIEVMKQTEVLQSLIETYSNKNGTSNYLLNPCQMIPEVDFPPENAADLVGEQKFQKPIWFIPTEDERHVHGDLPQHHPEISSNVCRQALRKAMCGLLRLAGFTDCSDSAIILLTDAMEEFLHSFVAEYRGVYDLNPNLLMSSELHLVPLEQAHTSLTGASLTQVHNYFKHKVITRNRNEIGEFNSVLTDYDKLMKESQSSMQKQQVFTGNDFLNILEMQPSDDGSGSATGGSSINIVGDMLQDLNSSSTTMSMGNASQHHVLSGNTLYGLLDSQMTTTTSNMPSTSNYQGNFE